ncbi:MAG: zinc ribbon domain-containing protein [Candidatus Heimdallarchaeum endolithica]|uniref:Zinc ribbon domain-containing protein n=1 Tax=Candidatus Heimdallarchaeum endolithica TaxID=2876572 RepID=A0A9Y1BR46_9ARCH|nr:MAG: zinc ribbon domain-containing protein [Candidatus Heimdallarchaeum endolithica]
MENEKNVVREIKLGFRYIGISFLVILIVSYVFFFIELSYIRNSTNYEYLWINALGAILSSLLTLPLYFSFLYLNRSIEKIEKSKESFMFGLFTILAIILTLFNIGLFLSQFLIMYSEFLIIFYLIFYILLLICIIFLNIFFVLSINKMNQGMEYRVVIWPIFIYVIIKIMSLIIDIVISILNILHISPVTIYTNIFYSIFQFLALIIKLLFIISMFFVANNAQISSLHKVPQYTSYSYSRPLYETKTTSKLKDKSEFCPYCGTKNSPDSKFCINCGKKID